MVINPLSELFDSGRLSAIPEKQERELAPYDGCKSTAVGVHIRYLHFPKKMSISFLHSQKPSGFLP